MAKKEDNVKLNNKEQLYERWARQDIKKQAQESMAKAQTLYDMDAIDEALVKQAEERAKEREEFYRQKAERAAMGLSRSRRNTEPNIDMSGAEAALASAENSEIVLYKAKAAAKNVKNKKVRVVKESFIHRTIRLIKGLRNAKKKIRSYDIPLPAEKARKLKLDVYNDAWAPVMDALRDLINTLWDFLSELWSDFEDIILTIFDVFITIGYYIGSFAIFIWDIIWDIRLWFEGKKSAIFQYFSATIMMVALVLILISSITGYEYSYYGRVLGTTRSKQDVYQTIEALGDKLSEAKSANININVERDIEFKKVYGFHLDVDSPEDILNTLTYMKDIQVRAFAVNIDGVRKVILEDEATANHVLAQIRNDFAPEAEGVEYTQINYDQLIAVEEVGVLLGDIWNPQDAIAYLETGSVHPVPEEEKAPLIVMRTTEIATYNEDVQYGQRFINNAEIYEDETELISAGIFGTNRVVAEVSRINGVEQSRKVQSTTRTKNPVDAVLYQGTKPIPARTGTGTFIWPLKSYHISSRFGGRETGIIGASTNHQGMDLAASSGSKIYASDGGEVTFSGWQAGYGYVVYIDHGGLYETRYGHCSKILVKVGDKIYQGQNIALVGSTGVSSGPHLHFEVRYKGVAYNPLNYLP